jgi:uncharacterized membrane protein
MSGHPGNPRAGRATGDISVKSGPDDHVMVRNAITPEAGATPASADSGRRVWMLRRNCSLSPRQSVFSFGLLAGGALVVATLCATAGAWVVLPCALIEMIVLGGFFLLYARHAVDYDCIELFDDSLTVVQCCGSNVRRFELNPLWVRVQMSEGRNPKIEIRYAGEVALVGRHVSSAYRERAVKEINRELRLRRSM